MIRYRAYPLERNDSKNYDDIGFFVFDQNMKKIWGDEVKMPYTEKQINNVAYGVSSNANVLMLVANRESEKYQAFVIDTKGELKTHDLDLSTEKYVRKLKIKENKQGNFACAGYYANGIEFKYNPFTGGKFVFNVNGLLYFEIDGNGKLLTQNSFDFSKEFIQQNLSDRQKKSVEKREEKGKAGILDLILLEFTVKEDGSAWFIGERQYAANEFWGPRKQYVYHFSNIVVMKVNPNGELAWMKKLPKNQAGLRGVGQMSIAYMQGDKADYVAFVDNPKNIELSPEDGVPSAHKDGHGGFITTYKINHQTGALEKHTICDLTDIKGTKAHQFKTNRIFKVNNGEFLTEIYIKRKEDAMVKFKLN